MAERCRKADPTTVLVSRDGIRAELFGEFTSHSQDQESLVTSIAEKAVDKALEMGRHVIVHDMNLRKSYRKRWAGFAVKHGADFKYIDLTGVPLDECAARDFGRECAGLRYVGCDVILDLHKRYLSNKQAIETPESLVEALKDTVQGHEPYQWTPGLLDAVIVDIDGTVALHEGVRNPYDTTRYHLDKPNIPVINAIHDECYANGKRILFVSGRDAKFRKVTEDWLYDNVRVSIEGLFMRPEGDTRRDDIVKLELFDNHIRGEYNISRVYDDRNRVVKAWRSIGLTVFQVAEGDF